MAEFEKFSQMLVSLRKRENLTQSKLAELTRVSFMTIRRWESGEVIPRIDEVKRLAEILHVTVEDLLKGFQRDKAEIVISWNWEDMKKGELKMEDNKFKLILGEEGHIGINGIGRITSLADIDEFLGRVREQLTIALDAQIKRGAIQPAVQGT